MFCKCCGKEVSEGKKFCTYCGNPILELQMDEVAVNNNTEENKQLPEGVSSIVETESQTENEASKQKKTSKEKKPKKEKKSLKDQEPGAVKKRKSKKKIFIMIFVFLLSCLIGVGGYFGYRYLMDFHIEIDATNLIYDEIAEVYYISEEFTSFTGEITGTTILIDRVTYEIKDANGVLISSGEASLDGRTWEIQEPGLMMGINVLNVTASAKVGDYANKSISVLNSNPAFQEHALVDVEDTDEDGLINYYEVLYSCDMNQPDTDGDGLTDYEEVLYTVTNPVLYSSLDDGVCDAERDADEDGLNNKEEIQLGLNPGNADTDGDQLLDGEEYLTIGTDPLKEDTDTDGATDFWEKQHGYDPLKKEEAFVAETKMTVIDSKVSASVKLSVKGNPESLVIEDAKIEGLLDETMTGYLGTAYSFSCEEEFSTAEITMTFDESYLESGIDPVIYEFIPETQTFEEVETTIQGNQASAVVSHGATYVLLDRKKVSEVVEEEIVTMQEIEGNIVNIGFVVDYSSSMNDNDPEYIRLKIVEEYISKLREGKDAGTLIQFAGYATTLVPLSTDKEMLINATKSITNTGSDSCTYNDAGTNGTDGLRRALDELAVGENATHRYIIFLTDGEDTTSSYNYDDLIAEAVSKGIVIYTVGMGSCDEELLTKIAESTGGKFHYASVADVDTDGQVSLEEAFAEIEKETVDYYADSNEDGISDYYTRLICEGILKTGTGANPFGVYTFEEVQEKGSDLDGDGINNGEEIVVTESGNYIYLKYVSSPIYADTDGDGHLDNADSRVLRWDVGDRDLAIFAALCYEDGTSMKGKMYSASQIEKKGYFYNYASIAEKGMDAGICQNWQVVDFVEKRMVGQFSATTFRCQDNIVIAYRGTDDAWEWVDNVVCYGFNNYHSEEGYARAYAKRIAKAYPNYKIYITGHSLGGYLAQIGTAELLQNTDVKPVRVAYFNGIGMNFADTIGLTQTKLILSPMSYVERVRYMFRMEDVKALQEYAKTGNLISYRIEGDIVSALGTHYGEIVPYEATEEFRTYNAGKYPGNGWKEWRGKVMTGVAGIITRNKIHHYYDAYGIESMKEYNEVTHSLASFYYYIPQGVRTNTK